MKSVLKALPTVILCALLGVLFFFTSRLVVPKWLYNENWPTTQTYDDFYTLEKNSVDVLFLGSSRSISAFSPLQLYADYGITSYNLGSEEQSLFISYYWLKEALASQSPQVVVLDTMVLFDFMPEYVLNCSEPSLRKTMDHMQLSLVKCQAIWDICRLDPSQYALSYVFPLLRFHDRIGELTAQDINYALGVRHEALMGYSALSGELGDAGEKIAVPYVVREGEDADDAVVADGTADGQAADDEAAAADDEADAASPHPLMLTYLDRITSLCAQKNITLILCNLPSTEETAARGQYLAAYAHEHDIILLDFNEASLYYAIAYDYATDNVDATHANYAGAIKITDHIGDLLSSTYGVAGRESSDHTALLPYYASILQDKTLWQVEDLAAYLALLDDPRYAVYVRADEEAAEALISAQGVDTPETTDAETADATSSRLAMCIASMASGIDDATTLASLSCTLDYATDDVTSITISDADITVTIPGDGLRIVVYSTDLFDVVDVAHFTLDGESYTFLRE